MINLFTLRSASWLIGCLLLCAQALKAQNDSTLTLEDCQAWAREHYPLTGQYASIEKTRELSVANAQKKSLPQLNLSGQATTQSEVTQIPVSVPGMDFPVLSKNQYRLYGEISQSITDLFTVKDQKLRIRMNSAIESQENQVDLYQIRDQINRLFFGILLIDEQLGQTKLLQENLERGIERNEVAITGGVALKSSGDNLKAELLKVSQRRTELRSNRNAYVAMLGHFIGKPLSPNTLLKRPARLQIKPDTVNRPEAKLFALQDSSLEIQSKLAGIQRLPKLSLFFQGGVGRPGLNILNNDMQDYYIAGVRLSWNVSGLYTLKNEKRILENNRDKVQVQRETFLFNTKLKLLEYEAEIDKIEALIAEDKQIIQHLEKVSGSTRRQLEYGTATTDAYLNAVSSEDQARQAMALHEIQLLVAQYNIKVVSGT